MVSTTKKKYPTFIGIPVTVVDFRWKCFCAMMLSLLTSWDALWELMVIDSKDDPWKSAQYFHLYYS